MVKIVEQNQNPPIHVPEEPRNPDAPAEYIPYPDAPAEYIPYPEANVSGADAIMSRVDQAISRRSGRRRMRGFKLIDGVLHYNPARGVTADPVSDEERLFPYPLSASPLELLERTLLIRCHRAQKYAEDVRTGVRTERAEGEITDMMIDRSQYTFVEGSHYNKLLFGVSVGRIVNGVVQYEQLQPHEYVILGVNTDVADAAERSHTGSVVVIDPITQTKFQELFEYQVIPRRLVPDPETMTPEQIIKECGRCYVQQVTERTPNAEGEIEESQVLEPYLFDPKTDDLIPVHGSMEYRIDSRDVTRPTTDGLVGTNDDDVKKEAYQHSHALVNSVLSRGELPVVGTTSDGTAILVGECGQIRIPANSSGLSAEIYPIHKVNFNSKIPQVVPSTGGNGTLSSVMTYHTTNGGNDTVSVHKPSARGLMKKYLKDAKFVFSDLNLRTKSILPPLNGGSDDESEVMTSIEINESTVEPKGFDTTRLGSKSLELRYSNDTVGAASNTIQATVVDAPPMMITAGTTTPVVPYGSNPRHDTLAISGVGQDTDGEYVVSLLRTSQFDYAIKTPGEPDTEPLPPPPKEFSSWFKAVPAHLIKFIKTAATVADNIAGAEARYRMEKSPARSRSVIGPFTGITNFPSVKFPPSLCVLPRVSWPRVGEMFKSTKTSTIPVELIGSTPLSTNVAPKEEISAVIPLVMTDWPFVSMKVEKCRTLYYPDEEFDLATCTCIGTTRNGTTACIDPRLLTVSGFVVGKIGNQNVVLVFANLDGTRVTAGVTVEVFDPIVEISPRITKDMFRVGEGFVDLSVKSEDEFSLYRFFGRTYAGRITEFTGGNFVVSGFSSATEHIGTYTLLTQPDKQGTVESKALYEISNRSYIKILPKYADGTSIKLNDTRTVSADQVTILGFRHGSDGVVPIDIKRLEFEYPADLTSGGDVRVTYRNDKDVLTTTIAFEYDNRVPDHYELRSKTGIDSKYDTMPLTEEFRIENYELVAFDSAGEELYVSQIDSENGVYGWKNVFALRMTHRWDATVPPVPPTDPASGFGGFVKSYTFPKCGVYTVHVFKQPAGGPLVHLTSRDVCVYIPDLVSIRVSTTKTVYEVGEKLDMSSLCVRGMTSDGNSIYIPGTYLEPLEFNTELTGMSVVTIGYYPDGTPDTGNVLKDRFTINVRGTVGKISKIVAKASIWGSPVNTPLDQLGIDVYGVTKAGERVELDPQYIKYSCSSTFSFAATRMIDVTYYDIDESKTYKTSCDVNIMDVIAGIEVTALQTTYRDIEPIDPESYVVIGYDQHKKIEGGVPVDDPIKRPLKYPEEWSYDDSGIDRVGGTGGNLVISSFPLIGSGYARTAAVPITIVGTRNVSISVRLTRSTFCVGETAMAVLEIGGRLVKRFVDPEIAVVEVNAKDENDADFARILDTIDPGWGFSNLLDTKAAGTVDDMSVLYMPLVGLPVTATVPPITVVATVASSFVADYAGNGNYIRVPLNAEQGDYTKDIVATVTTVLPDTGEIISYSLDPKYITLDGWDTTSVGLFQATVGIKDLTGLTLPAVLPVMDVDVYDPDEVLSLEVGLRPGCSDTVRCGAEIDVNATFIVKGNTVSGRTIELVQELWTVTGYDSSNVGDCTLKFIYNPNRSVVAEYTIHIIHAEVISIAGYPNPLNLTMGEDIRDRVTVSGKAYASQSGGIQLEPNEYEIFEPGSISVEVPYTATIATVGQTKNVSTTIKVTRRAARSMRKSVRTKGV